MTTPIVRILAISRALLKAALLPIVLFQVLRECGNMNLPFGYYDEDDRVKDEWLFYGINPEPQYSAVQILDVECDEDDDPLLGFERVVHHDDLKEQTYTTHLPSTRRIGFTISSDYPSSKKVADAVKSHVVSLTKGKLMDPADGSAVVSADSFELVLSGKHHLDDPQSWRFFAATGLDVFNCGHKENIYKDNRAERWAFDKYRMNLRPGTEAGVVQFFQSARQGSKNRNGQFPYGSLLNLYVYRGPEARMGDSFYPPVISVMPRHKQTYVPLQTNQVLQVVTPANYKVEALNVPSLPAVKMIHRHPASVEAYHCTYFKCNRQPVDSYPVVFQAQDMDVRGLVIVPPIETHHGKRYAILHAPMDGLILHTAGVDGFIFRTSENIFQGRHLYLDSTFKLKIESGPYRFTAPPNHEGYDLKVVVMDKTLSRIQIRNLLKADVCTATPVI